MRLVVTFACASRQGGVVVMYVCLEAGWGGGDVCVSLQTG